MKSALAPVIFSLFLQLAASFTTWNVATCQRAFRPNRIFTAVPIYDRRYTPGIRASYSSPSISYRPERSSLDYMNDDNSLQPCIDQRISLQTTRICNSIGKSMHAITLKNDQRIPSNLDLPRKSLVERPSAVFLSLEILLGRLCMVCILLLFLIEITSGKAMFDLILWNTR